MKPRRKIDLLALLTLTVTFSFGIDTSVNSIQDEPKTAVDNKHALFHPLILFYQPDGYYLKKEDSLSIKEFISGLRNNQSISFTISAYTDPTGSVGYNQRLAMLRADEVKKILITNGIDETRINVKALGESCSGNIPPSDYHKMRKVELSQIQMMK